MSSKVLKQLIKRIGLSRADIYSLPSGGAGLSPIEFETSPYEFLVRAEQDYQLGGDASSLNAIINAKRAIVSQLDQALMSFGYPAFKMNVPDKVKVMQSLGLVTPRILKKVSLARNMLEHEYRRPTVAQIEDAIDVAALFIAATKPVLQSFPFDFAIGHREEILDGFAFKRQLGVDARRIDRPLVFKVVARIDVRRDANGLTTGKTLGSTVIGRTDDGFGELVQLALATDTGFRLEPALTKWCNAVAL